MWEKEMELGKTLYQQLHKLSAIKSEEDLEQILVILWASRKTGLSLPQKSHFQSLLNLPSTAEVDLVLACLRSLIRKCSRENLSGDDLLKLFPPDLSLDLQDILILQIQKHQNSWNEEVSKEKNLLPRAEASLHVNEVLLSSFMSSLSDNILPFRQDNAVNRFINKNMEIPMPIIDETNVTHLASIPLQHDVGPSDDQGSLPLLKSMTWTVENQNDEPANRLAIICLKLQDYSLSPSGETEVKFQLTKDSLEAMLKSLACMHSLPC
ncbi:uncharacterized protein LOC124915123 [Impatiens glandulifera]|uniref:uncharacterized protein LOC124915123 n=1 Tax=Impatiens glandulifera TaxID=253017 RepID=UPI001FB0A5B0|nr:uncharacterized protein LOC124915123 [Impatiens glandulifera]